MSEARSGQGALKSGGTQARGHTTDHTRLLRTDRWRARAQPGPVGLLEGIDRTFLTTKRFVAIMLALTLLLAALLIGVLQPRASTYTYLTRDLRRAHEGMLDQETGTRAWYATRDDSFLEAVDEAWRASTPPTPAWCPTSASTNPWTASSSTCASPRRHG